MRRVLLAFAVLISTSSPVWAEAAVSHGKTSDGRDWFTYHSNHATAGEANAAAMADCNQTAFNCSIETQFHSLCFAMVFGSQGTWAWSTGVGQQDANRSALARCAAPDPYCHVVTQFCDTVSEQQVEAQKEYDVYKGNWDQCQGGADDACVRALDYNNITEWDRGVINSKRTSIAEDARSRRQAILDLKEKEDIEQKKEDLKQQLLRLQEAQNLLAAKRDEEAAARKNYESELIECKAFDESACNRALAFADITPSDRTIIMDARDARSAFIEQRDKCETGTLEACDAALRSPALLATERTSIVELRQKASPAVRVLALVSKAGWTGFGYLSGVSDGANSLKVQVLGLPPSTQIVSGIALTFAVATLVLLWRQRRLLRVGRRTRSSTSGVTADFTADAKGNVRSHRTQTIYQSQVASGEPSLDQPSSVGAGSSELPAEPKLEEQRAVAVTPEPGNATAAVKKADPVTAKQALRLAWAYLCEVEGIGDDLEDPSKLAKHRTTMALATKQLDIARRADPTAMLEQTGEDGTSTALTQAWLRAALLTDEGYSYILEKPSKSIALFRQATGVEPEFVRAHYLLGVNLFDRREKAGAVAALERALLLEPDNIEIIKALDRARNMSGIEQMSYHATRAATTAASVSIKIYWVVRIGISLLILSLFPMTVYFVVNNQPGDAAVIWIILAILGGIGMLYRRGKQWLSGFID